MRVVFDTNVFIAAAIKEGFTNNLIELSAEGQIELLTSEEILEELRQKLSNKFKWKKEKIDLFINRLQTNTKIVTTTKSRIKAVDRDPEDNKILECAISGNADIIVTADQDLIKLKEFRGIAIIHPRTLAWTFTKYFKKNKKQ